MGSGAWRPWEWRSSSTTSISGGTAANYPLAAHVVGRWLYANGSLLVDLFFLLSGIIFTARYLKTLAEGQISGREFFLLRFSRLYPLHLFALLLCAAIEWTLLWFHQAPVVYDRVGLYDFVLQAFYLHMAFWNGWAFNAPTWSVSAEILAYVSFFLLASRYPKRYVATSIVIVIVGLGFESSASPTNGGLLILNGMLAKGLVGFYVGSLGYLAMRWVEQLGHPALFGRVCLGIFAAVAVLATRFGYDAWIGASSAANCLGVFFPLVFATLQIRLLGRLLALRPLVFLGEISYSIYLVHVPIQMTILAIARARRFAVPTGSPIFMAGYAVTLVCAATAVHFALEKPALRWLRRRFRQPAPVVLQPAPSAGAPLSPTSPAGTEPAVLSVVRE